VVGSRGGVGCWEGHGGQLVSVCVGIGIPHCTYLHTHPLTHTPKVVKVLNLEEGGAFTVSSADQILEALG
jgi:hypothetical protein